MQTCIESRAAPDHVTARDQLAYMACGLWMISGLYVDGWAHQANKPETFFTPWHALLYSGFGAAMVYASITSVRNARSGIGAALGEDRVTLLGVALFMLGAGGDFLWHEIAGIEDDLEALISPTHLLLMIGGLLMVTLPLRAPKSRVAATASVGLSLALVMFFLMYLSPWAEAEPFARTYLPDDEFSNLSLQVGMATVVLTTVLFCGAALWLARQRLLQPGTITVIFTGVALAQSGLEGFNLLLPVLAATLAGAAADGLLHQGRSLPATGAVIGLTLSASYFALLHADQGVGWGPSLWVGAITFATIAGYATGLAVQRQRP
jgi:hypothetical protein